MASAAGALVTGVSTAKNRDFVLGLGASEVIDRNATDLAAAYGPGSFDVVIDKVGGRIQWEQARRVLRPGGEFVTISRNEDDVIDAAAILRLLVATRPRLLRSLGPRRTKYVPAFLSLTVGQSDGSRRKRQCRSSSSPGLPFDAGRSDRSDRAEPAGHAVGKLALKR